MSLAVKIPFLKNNESDFSRALTISLGVHFCILSFFLLKTVFFPVDMEDFDAAVRVDIVDMPDKITNQVPTVETPKEEKKEEPIPEKKVEPVALPKPEVQLPKEPPKPQAIDLNKTKSQQKEALNKLKSMSAIEKIQQDLKKNKGKEEKAVAQFKGNVLSPGTELTGVNKLQHESYRGDVYRHAKKNWALPEWLARSQLQALILIKLDERGYVVYKRITKSSGNPSYDDAVLGAIDSASPFPPPPSKFRDVVSTDGITIEFVPDK